jgi:solute:Na+ symporter, SSS family
VELESGLPEIQLTTLDVVVAITYIAIIVGIGFWVGRGKENAEGFFLGERGSVWPLVGFALMAANFSGTHFLGLAGAGYHDGISVWNYEWMATLILIFFALFILPFYLRSKVDTMPQFLEHRYDRRSRYAFSAFSIFTAMLIDSAGALYAGAIAAQLLLPEVPLWILVSGIAVIAGVYVMAGGLRAVMITDTLDGILLLIAGGVLFYLGYVELGSWQAIKDVSPDGLSLIRPADDDFMPWPGVFTGVLWLGFYYWTTNHVVVQKALSARNLDHGRWGALFAGFMQLPFLFILILPGVIGRALYPDLAEPDQVWPAMVFDFLPVGIRAVVFAALVAALMSTLDSVLNGASSLVVNDFIKTRDRWDFSDKQLLRISRATIGVFMVIAALWAPQIMRFEGLVEYFQSFLAHITMPVVVVFLGGLFWPRSTRHAAFYTLVIAAPIGFAAFLAGEVFEVFQLQFLYGAGVMLLFSGILFVTISLVTVPPDREKVAEMTWSRRYWAEESKELEGKPFWQNYRVLSAALAVATLAMIWIFR